MCALRIRLFGAAAIFPPGATAPARLTRSTVAMLAYLLLQPRRPCARDLLLDAFWGDLSQERARNCLNTTLWRLRRVLEPSEGDRGAYLVATATGDVGFNWESDHWIDVVQFERLLAPVLAKPVETLNTAEVQAMQEALSLYQGDLLEGIYEDWALRERERLRRLYLDSLAQLMHHYAHTTAYAQGAACARRILALDPLREEIHRALMRLYVWAGQRTEALRQYEECRRVLAEELAAPPMEETELLYRQILAGATLPPLSPPRPASSRNGSSPSSGAHNLLHNIRQALRQVDQARATLQEAIRNLEEMDEER
ncbi:MAG TPA: BTAD domain-containing putative transcriptional regulator [Caldilineaceae bacterium]|nr:BTAD domain-containing putative transcriptional regulator [Caldilineaceae bacterium]